MAIYKYHLKELIESTLKEVGLYSPEAVELLMGTSAQESALGKYLKQLGKGPALGIFQMEPNTFKDITNNWLKTDLRDKILIACSVRKWHPEHLVYNLKFAICMTRVFYLRKPGALPSDLQGQAEYWKKHYNTDLGRGTVEEYIKNYKKYVL